MEARRLVNSPYDRRGKTAKDACFKSTVLWFFKHRQLAYCTSQTCHYLLVATTVLILLQIGSTGCRQNAPSEDEFLITLDQAFEKVEHQDQIVVIGAITNWNQNKEGNAVWAFLTPVMLQPKGKSTGRQKTSSDSIKSLVESIKFSNTQVPEIIGDSCEFSEWQNGQGTWRMRTANTPEAFMMTLEKIETLQKGVNPKARDTQR